ncbi:response regulator [bacterium]|nr:MAG: response regulator [bacterium]
MNYENIEILYVEDNQYDIELTLRVFKKQNVANKVHVVKDGEKALEFIFATGEYEDRKIENLPKFILLDLKLPKINGIEVLKQIKANELTKVIPVVMLTSSAEDVDKLESYKLGVNSYVVKPVDFEKMNKVISDITIYWLEWNKSLA